MPNRTQIVVRPLEVRDFAFVRKVAAAQANFTIPPPYVLWLLTKIKGDICLVAQSDQGPMAYLLAVPMDEPANSIYIWQLASTKAGSKGDAVLTMLRALYGIAKSTKIESIFFSALPKSTALRRIEKYIYTISAKRPRVTSQLTDIVAPGEMEYQVSLQK